jgi:D-alanyl-D-alanine carboxypeptidase
VSVRAPGLVVAAARGYADVDEKRRLHTDTPFRIASVTKTFVAAAVLRQVEAGKVGLDAPVSKYLSPATLAQLTAGGYETDQITVRQLLDHTSGLSDYASSDAYDSLNTDDPGRVWTPGEQIDFAMRNGRPLAAPGAEYHYADTNYVLLGELLERTTGTPLPQAVRDSIGFDRIGLTRTWWERMETAPVGLAARAHQYYGTSFDNSTLDPSADLYGGGGLISTVGDLTLFYRALFDGQIFENESTLKTMLTVSKAGQADGGALGIFATTIAGEQCWGHPGYWGTEAYYCPTSRLAFALTTNQANEADIDTTKVEQTILSLR